MARAFTLVETLIVVGLAAIVTMGAAQLSLVFGRMLGVQESALDVVLDASAVIDAVRSAGAQSSRVADTHSFFGVAYASATTTVIFELPAVDAAGAVIPSAFDYVGIHASGTDAYRFTDAATGSSRVSGTRLLANTLQELRFSYDSVSFPLVTKVVADATTTAAAGGGETQKHLRGVVYLRNL